MVLGVCRRLLRHEQDAEDVFQATFLILARKARSVSRPELLGPWLYRVAYRAALKALARTGRRREGPVTEDVPAPEPPERLEPEARAALDEELGRLPERYRAPLVLCYLEGKSIQDAARALGCPKGTVFSRMARGRDRLRRRLRRRGLLLAGPALAAVLPRGAASAAEVPPDLAAAAVRGAAGGRAPAAARSLADDVLRDMARQRLLLGSVCGLVVLAAAGAAGSFAYRAAVVRGPAAGAAIARAENRPPDPPPAAEAVGFDAARAAVARDDGLQGKWKIVSGRWNGRDVPGGPDLPTDIVFRDDRFTFVNGNATISQGPFRLVPGNGPKGIDMIYEGVDGRPFDGRPFKGIYSLDGDTLTLSQRGPGQDRPAVLASPPGAEIFLFVFRRQRP
jgi:RNA polymerase sigma factor (sigma-70 family)